MGALELCLLRCLSVHRPGGWLARLASPRSLRRKFTTERQPLLLATAHRSLLAASHSLRKKYTFLLLCHLGNLLTMNTRAFLLIFYVVRVFMLPRPLVRGHCCTWPDSLFMSTLGARLIVVIGINCERSLRLAFLTV
jgi:hypothetical protein